MANLDAEDLRAIGNIVALHIAPVSQRADETRRAVFGNGQPGLVEDVAALKAERGRVPLAMLFAGISACVSVISVVFLIGTRAGLIR